MLWYRHGTFILLHSSSYLDKKDGNEVDENLEYSDENDDIDVIAL